MRRGLSFSIQHSAFSIQVFAIPHSLFVVMLSAAKHLQFDTDPEVQEILRCAQNDEQWMRRGLSFSIQHSAFSIQVFAIPHSLFVVMLSAAKHLQVFEPGRTGDSSLRSA